MTREIKFRAWNKKRNIILKNAQDIWEEWGNYNFASVLEDKNMIVMQFTGLKDKNGKEIFEGDILFNKGVLVGVVEFGEYKCKNQSKHDRQLSHIGWFVTKDNKEFLSLEYLFWNLQQNLSIQKRENQNWVEIKGTKFENPELLK